MAKPNDTLRNLIIYFGAIFSNIRIIRDDGTEFKVPISFAPREKFLARLRGNPETDKEVAISLPQISYEVMDISHDPTRQRNAVGIVKGVGSSYQYNPVPYNIEISMSVISKNQIDAMRVVEQILPIFPPTFTGSARINQNLPDAINVPITLNSVVSEDVYEGDWVTRRSLIYTFSFTMKALFFGKVYGEDGNGIQIKKIDIDYYFDKEGNLVRNSSIIGGQDKTTNEPVDFEGRKEDVPQNLKSWNTVNFDEPYGYVIGIEDDE